LHASIKALIYLSSNVATVFLYSSISVDVGIFSIKQNNVGFAGSLMLGLLNIFSIAVIISNKEQFGLHAWSKKGMHNKPPLKF
jgi:hypothetical protein